MTKFFVVLAATLAALSPVLATPTKKLPKNALTPVITQHYGGQRKTINTSLNFTTVDSNVAYLVGYSHYEGCTTYGASTERVNGAIESKNLTMFENAIEALTGPTDFMVFNMLYYTSFMPLFIPDTIAQAKTYIIGNPIVAETMLKWDTIAGLHVPTRIVVSELFDAKNKSIGTSVVWDVPSTLIAIGHLPAATEKKLKAAALILDSNVENMVRNATGVW
ncbi:hypothetical protein DL93DRAFT_2166677 [Clavulina sp. PMI_390]|nr:hypothetical protein DL93DRAFT_2166677 [Clavulina sp. PMI_390]